MPSPARYPAANEDDTQGLDPEVSIAHTARPKYSHESLVDDLTKIEVDEADLQKVVVNYLSTHMYKDSYANFIEESGYQGPNLAETISHRQCVKQAIIEGRTQDARTILDKIDPKILENNVRILFNLLANDVIDIIKSGNVTLAIEYAREKLAPCVKKETGLVEKLEDIMALLTFTDFSLPEVTEAIRNVQQLEETAILVDIAIMEHFEQDTHVILEALVKEALWLQKQLADEPDWGRINYQDIERAGISLINEDQADE
ncbi:glucose-induced degradation 8 homolog isoform X2, putative [Babesia ovis]|uniref:Glucose-induced degradation 8 homolog isoform X2, putative n=1 Tax=Babesia ovis TaxID=5869 RepID=A0A9W5TCS0_BABOV|nr:glucose-induced degradation 8 homolog isoform X2, putative [Babesia ovis]